MHSTLVKNHGCTSRPIDPHFDTIDKYDIDYIQKTVYELASQKDDSLATAVNEALEVIEEAYRLYGLDGIALSFNGGKDCTVLLHLVVAVLSRMGHKKDELLRTVFVTYPNAFPHVDAFVNICIKRYHLDCVPIAGPMRQALQQYLDITQPRPKAIFVGIRRHDPYAENLTHFDMTDKGWPEFIRVHPIIDWSYKNIWDFLIKLRIPYCSLYDEGYTSLGSMENTHPNPDLETDHGHYQPAFMLKNELHERCGRIGSSKK
ncbi:uncharacterized protein BX664DRAFT_335811 [Halteromyces radiatus]|uniref:uncharacterized protein n=1 Tax=Halteromyces radiatus TaxID=101107 RepID=UPI00221F3311|nr:uncharacterized protein BX664DRAFT_335811 [Halteromyces radiatus]KAI8086443.1 hypothetical protein BX664DRAFT_335811 [Halteromyces radiatus]